MTVTDVNGVAMIDADVQIDEAQFSEAYMQRCRTRMYRATTGDRMQDVPFDVTVNGTKSQAFIICEADDECLVGTTIVARYRSSADERGDWYSLIVIKHYANRFEPQQRIRGIETGVTLGLHIDARRLLNVAP